MTTVSPRIQNYCFAVEFVGKVSSIRCRWHCTRTCIRGKPGAQFVSAYSVEVTTWRLICCASTSARSVSTLNWTFESDRLTSISIRIVAILLIDLSPIKRRRTTFSFFLFALIFFIAIITCYMYILYRFFFHRSTVSYPIDFKAVLRNLCFVFFFSFLFFYTYYFYIFIVCISFFLYTYIYIYVVKPVNRHERFFAKIDRFSMILIRVKQTDIRRLEQSAINDRWREKSSSKRKTLF